MQSAVQIVTRKVLAFIFTISLIKEKDRRLKWINAVACKNWEPTRHSWICSVHFVSRSKDDDLLFPDYVPSLFSHIKSSMKRRLNEGMKHFERVSQAKRRRVEIGDKQEAARSLLTLSEIGNSTTYCGTHSGIFIMTALTMKDLSEFEADRARNSNTQSQVG